MDNGWIIYHACLGDIQVCFYQTLLHYESCTQTDNLHNIIVWKQGLIERLPEQYPHQAFKG